MDLASAVVGIASFGVQVSSALYKFSDSARNAETDIVGLAQNIELTSNVLQSVGQILQRDEIAQIPNVATKTAIIKTLKGCDTLFQEIMHQISKKRKLNDDGSHGAVRTYAKFTWPFQKDRMDFSTRKLEHMKTLMLLLLQVLQLAAMRKSVTSVGPQTGLTNSAVTDQGSSILALKKRLDTLESQFPDLCLDEEADSAAGTTLPSYNTDIKIDHALVSSSTSGPQQVATQKDVSSNCGAVSQAEEKPQVGSSSDSGISMQHSLLSHQNLPEPSEGYPETMDPLLTEAAINVCFESINIVLGQLKHCQRCLYLDEQPHGDKLAAQRDLRAKFDDMVSMVHSTLPLGNEPKANNSRPPSLRGPPVAPRAATDRGMPPRPDGGPILPSRANAPTAPAWNQWISPRAPVYREATGFTKGDSNGDEKAVQAKPNVVRGGWVRHERGIFDDSELPDLLPTVSQLQRPESLFSVSEKLLPYEQLPIDPKGSTPHGLNSARKSNHYYDVPSRDGSEPVIPVATTAHMRRKQEHEDDDCAKEFERSEAEKELKRERDYWQPERKDLDGLREDQAYMSDRIRDIVRISRDSSSSCDSDRERHENDEYRSRAQQAQVEIDGLEAAATAQRAEGRSHRTSYSRLNPFNGSGRPRRTMCVAPAIFTRRDYAYKKVYSVDEGISHLGEDNHFIMQPRYRDGMYRDTGPRRRHRSGSSEGSRRRPSSSVIESHPQSRPSARERDPPTSSALDRYNETLGVDPGAGLQRGGSLRDTVHAQNDSHANIGKDVLSALVFKYTNLLEFDGVERPQ